MKISVIIPTFNEAQNLSQSLTCLSLAKNSSDHNLEVIITDGGSQDKTLEIAQQFGVKPIQAELGRSRQMNQAAKIASGEILLFLHADTRLPQNWMSLVEQTLQNPNVIAGAFELAIDSPKRSLRWVELGVKLRSRFLQLPYGDQAIFLRAETFQAIGGFPDLSIMEDFVLVQRLKQYGRIAIVPAAVQTSARRWENLGVFQTTLINQVIVLGFYLGFSPERLKQWYQAWRYRLPQSQSDTLH